jgi:hypothetical protein
MATDADEIVVGANGSVHVAPVGTAGPADIETALNASFIDLGFVSDDGIEITPGMDSADINAWQSFYPVRRIVTGRTLEIGLTLLQWNEDSIALAFGGGSVSTTAGPPAYYTYTPPSPDEIDYRAMVIEWQDDTKTYRLHIPKVLVTDTSSLSLNRTDPAGLALTFSAQGTDGADVFTLITDDPAFAA